jgi:hypothetical protein
VKSQFHISVGNIVLEDDVSGNPEDEDLHDGGLDAASPSESSESDTEEDFSHEDSQTQIR